MLISFFNIPSNTQATAEPAANATRYINGFPTVRNTKIPPCGAINVQLNAIDKAPATAEPATQAGNTRSGSDAAKGKCTAHSSAYIVVIDGDTTATGDQLEVVWGTIGNDGKVTEVPKCTGEK